jgi:DNA-3-methyladenine glycosylase I
MRDTIHDACGNQRCWWCGRDDLYVRYHDHEWGLPVGEDQRLFEKICLEGFQAGLSWITILKKRPAFRQAFDDFDFTRVAGYREDKIDRLTRDRAIVRHRGKIESAVNNARRAIEVIDTYGSLAAFFWRFEPVTQRVVRCRDEIPSKTKESTALAKGLKQLGWTFVGPTTCYAFMQAMGMVNDHVHGCDAWHVVDQARQHFVRPR